MYTPGGGGEAFLREGEVGGVPSRTLRRVGFTKKEKDLSTGEEKKGHLSSRGKTPLAGPRRKGGKGSPHPGRAVAALRERGGNTPTVGF